MLRMVFHSRVTNSHHCHDMFQLLIQTECRNAYIQNDNQRGAGQRGPQATARRSVAHLPDRSLTLHDHT